MDECKSRAAQVLGRARRVSGVEYDETGPSRDAARALRSCGDARAGRGSAASFRRRLRIITRRPRSPIGRAFTSASTAASALPPSPMAEASLLGSSTGGLIGFTGGYNYMVAPNLLIGLEGDFDFSGNKNSQLPYYGFTTNTSIDGILFTIRGRVGYTFDRALVYITGGFAGSNNTVSVGNIWDAVSRGSNPPGRQDGRWRGPGIHADQ